MVWRSWWSSTPKLVTVSHSGLGTRRTLVRSSVERWIVIMIVQSSCNKAEVLRALRSGR